jgi:hypothetical protein
VTHCKSNDNYDQYLRLEYLSYRVWSLVSPLGLRARLVDVDYFDTGRERGLGLRPGILLEDEQRFAERQGLSIFEGPAVERAKYDAESLALLDVFQYFLGNTDWSALAGSVTRHAWMSSPRGRCVSRVRPAICRCCRSRWRSASACSSSSAI